jgi:hypothetical protein
LDLHITGGLATINIDETFNETVGGGGCYDVDGDYLLFDLTQCLTEGAEVPDFDLPSYAAYETTDGGFQLLLTLPISALTAEIDTSDVPFPLDSLLGSEVGILLTFVVIN